MSKLRRLRQQATVASRDSGKTIHVNTADHRRLALGRWWRIRGRYHVICPGVVVIGPLPYRRARDWINRIATYEEE